jgi:dihydroorotase-like cyclic amidohydrolase
VAFKLFTKSPAAGREREFAGLWATDEGAILDALEAVAATGRICVVHAESDALLRHFAERARDDGRPASPPIVETLAITSVAALAAEADARVHIAHVSSRSALAAVRAALTLHQGLTAETCPQYLLLDSSARERHGGAAKIAPPLREPADRSALWEGLADGTIAIVSSDHSPFLLAEKTQVDYAKAPQGLPTVELLVPTVLDAAARGVLPLALAVSLVTSAPARLFALSPRKGTISEGADADIAIASLSAPYRPSPRTLLSRAADCGIVFDHMTLTGRVATTIVGGQVVFRDRQIVGDPVGRFVSSDLTFEQV